MNNIYLTQAFRFLFLLLLQVLVFKRLSLSFESFNYISVFIYPIFILLLPHRISHVALVVVGFLTGLSVDIFYSSPGIHAAASVFTAYMRPTLLKIFEPRGGYAANQSPTKHQVGIGVFIRYAAAFLFLHLIFYFSVQAFSFVYIKEILLRTTFSFLVSLVFIVLYQYLFNPKS
ncbi:MAG: hypothetical protein HKN16_13525 [Saprospiraceae bacterium]|nr:hypothetical protein [Saprospiraceae bacterium]